MANLKYPYQDRTTLLLKGEKWKDVPEFEGYYQCSSLGRVKSMDRVIPHPRLIKQFVKGRILSQSTSYQKNTVSDERMVDLRVSLNLENTQYYFNVRRLVYLTFIGKLDYKKDGLYVINKDCNGFNNAVSNLAAFTKSEKTLRAFERERVPESYLRYADRSQWKNESYGGMSRRKPIRQLTLKGKLVQQYDSIKEASRKTGYGEKEIIMVAKGRWRRYNGFIWKYV